MGKIQYWNDSRIINDNSMAVAAKLKKISSPVNMVVRTDSSGTSEIFSTALSLFSNTGTSSFSSVVGKGSTPKWCGMKTDEVQVVTISGCGLIGSKLIHMIFIDGTYSVRDLLFNCDATAQNLTSIFSHSTQISSGFNVTVNKVFMGTPNGAVKYTIGFSDSRVITKNWYKLRLISAPAGVTVNVTTLQEGGYLNSHYNSSAYFVTPVIQSLWLLKAASPFQFSIYWYSSSSKQSYVTGHITYTNGQNSSRAIYTAINTILPGAISSSTTGVTLIDHSMYSEYRITFASSTDGLSYTNFSVSAVSATAHSAYIITLLDSNNYPLFYDAAHPSGYGGSGR